MLTNNVQPREHLELLDEATNFFCARQYAQSLPIWCSLLERYAQYLSSDDLYNASLAARYAQEFKLADTWINIGLERYPEDSRFWLDFAKLAMNQANWQAAISRFKAIPANNYNVNVAKFYGVSLFRAGHIEAAIEILLAAFERNPDNIQLLVDCEHIYQQAKNINIAIGKKINISAKANNVNLQALTASAEHSNFDIVHVMHPGKFSWEFLNFTRKNKLVGKHSFMMFDDGSITKWPSTDELLIYGNQFIDRQQAIRQLVKTLKHARIIILHSLFNHLVLEALYQNQELLPKCYWFIWGSDLHNYKSLVDETAPTQQNFIAQSVIKKIGYIVCHNKQNYELAKEYYDIEGDYVCSFKYESNMCEVLPDLIEVESPHTKAGVVNILVGNSASLANEHAKMFRLIAPFKNKKISVICPLNYGDQLYASYVEKLGKQYFGSNFVAIREAVSADDYYAFLSKIDIGIFCHNPDQGMGTIRRLLSLGKKVFVNQQHGANFLSKQFEIALFDADSFNLDKTFEQQKNNIVKMRQHYSKKALIDSLNGIFNV